MRNTIISLLLLTFSLTAHGDRVTSVYGDVWEGTIVGETDTTVTLRGQFGEITLSRSDIRQVDRGDVASSAPLPSSPSQQPQTPAQAPVSSPPPALPSQGTPDPYSILKRNVEIQSQWQDLEIAYLQRAYVGGQTVQTQYVARIIPPNYLRANLTTPIPANPQFPQGGEVEYDMYRAKSNLYQVVKAPGQVVQYLKLDMSLIDGLQPGDNPVEGFRHGFAGAATDEELLRALSRNSAVVGSEYTDGNDCWVLETINTPDLVEAQVRKHPTDIQERLRQELSELGRIRSWVGKEDLIQWRMENYSREGDLLLSLKMINVKPNQGLTPQQLRMKVPKGTEFIDVTEMVAGQFSYLVGGAPGVAPIPSPGQSQGSPPAAPYQSVQPPQTWPAGQSSVNPNAYQGYPPPQNPQLQPAPTYASASPYPPGNFVPPQSQGAYAVPQTRAYPPTQPQSQWRPQPSYTTVSQIQPTAPGYSTYPGQPQALPQNYVQPITSAGTVPRSPSQGGGFFSRIFNFFGGSRNPAPAGGGYPPPGRSTMMLPVVNGQPQFSGPPR